MQNLNFSYNKMQYLNFLHNSKPGGGAMMGIGGGGGVTEGCKRKMGEGRISIVCNKYLFT